MNTATGRMVRTELKLMLREPLTLIFVFVFPVVTMLIIGGSFGTKPSGAFDGVNPSHWYVASYLTVVIAATGLIMVPVHLASYRERGVLRRFSAAGFSRWWFALAEAVTGLVAVAGGASVLLAVAAPVYGLPPLHDPVAVVTGFSLGAVAFVAIGVLLGTAAALGPLRSGRRAGAVLPVVPPRRRGTAAQGDGLGPTLHRRLPAPHPGQRRGARSLARDRPRDHLAGRRRSPGRRRYRARGPAVDALSGIRR